MATETGTAARFAVTESGRVVIRCRYYGPTNTRGSRIVVARWDSTAWGKDPHRITVGWDYNLPTTDNYAEAVRQYLAGTDWAGVWTVSTCPDGAVATYSGQVTA